MSRKRGKISIPQSLSHHEYVHRLMSVYGLIHTLKAEDENLDAEFLIRSAMIGNILLADHHDKLEIEAGILSFIPQYCKYDTKKQKAFINKMVTDHLGRNRAELMKEVEELRMSFVNEEEDIRGYSLHAINIYGIHVYLDLINMLNPFSEHKIIDGEPITVKLAKKDSKKFKKGERYILCDGERMKEERFYAFMVSMAEWKLKTLLRCHCNVKQYIEELCKQIRKQKGVEIYYREYND